MTSWPFVGRRERVRRQAARWIARLNGRHGASERAAFERWYGADADNAAAYDRLSALFEAAMEIAPPTDAEPAPTRLFRARPVGYALAAAVIALVVLLAPVALGTREAARPVQDEVRLATVTAIGGQSRRLVLADGSEIVLAPGSELDVALGASERRLRLRRGEGRFTVSHDSRPFVVTAGGTQVVARGTRFVVRLGGSGTLVSLIQGRIDVAYPPAPDRAERRVEKLTAGQQVVVPAVAPQTAPDRSGSPTLSAMIAFDDARLVEAIARVNARAERRIRLADPALADLRVTGAFRAGDAEGFAQSIAAALGLELAREEDGSLSLHASRDLAPRR